MACEHVVRDARGPCPEALHDLMAPDPGASEYWALGPGWGGQWGDGRFGRGPEKNGGAICPPPTAIPHRQGVGEHREAVLCVSGRGLHRTGPNARFPGRSPHVCCHSPIVGRDVVWTAGP